MNAERAAFGLQPMAMRADANVIAQAHSAAMAAAGTIWHNEQYLTQTTRAALAAKMLGENVGMGPSVDQVHGGFMHSPGHKANIVEPVFTIVGVGVVRSPSGIVYVTQDFVQPSGGTPRPAAVKAVATKPAPKPRPAAAPKPRPVSAPKAPATTAPPTTEAPATTTTTVAAQPDSSVLAAFDRAPKPAPAPARRSEASGPVVLVAFVLVAASATGAVRLRLTRRA